MFNIKFTIYFLHNAFDNYYNFEVKLIDTGLNFRGPGFNSGSILYKHYIIAALFLQLISIIFDL